MASPKPATFIYFFICLINLLLTYSFFLLLYVSFYLYLFVGEGGRIRPPADLPCRGVGGVINQEFPFLGMVDSWGTYVRHIAVGSVEPLGDGQKKHVSWFGSG